MEASHERLREAVVALNGGASTMVGSVSRHVLPDVVTFTDLARLHSIVKDENRTQKQLDFVATSGRSLVFSSRVAPIPAHVPSSLPGASGSSKKRRRDDVEDQCEAVQEARRRMERQHTDISSACYTKAENVLRDALCSLRGPYGEILLQSQLMLRKKLQPNDTHHTLVVALRLNAGIPVPVTTLKRVLGDCWTDGVLASVEDVMNVTGTDLPMSEEGAASDALGNASMLVVTSVRAEEATHGSN